MLDNACSRLAAAACSGTRSATASVRICVPSCILSLKDRDGWSAEWQNRGVGTPFPGIDERSGAAVGARLHFAAADASLQKTPERLAHRPGPPAKRL
eukprot:scaffold23175_cov115-Isochrysis_galbana.AAC.10